MTRAGAAALVMARAGERTDAGAGLRELLGPERAVALTDALEAEAQRWASEIAPGRVQRADGPLADAAGRALATRDGPLLVVWPVLARMRLEHASGALGDLRDGADLVIGPVIDGGLYLLGLSRPLPDLLRAGEERWSGGDAMTTALQAAAESGLEVGILRAERALRKPSDVRAALADPLTPERIRRIIGSG